jgi:hypothetical protein
MANDALAPSKRRRSDPAGPQLHRAADADVQERGVFQEPEAHPADVRHALAQEEIRLLQAELSRARAACAEKDSEILYLQNSQEEIRLLQAELSRARDACADKDSEIIYLQNLVVRLQPLVVPCRMLAAAFPPPPVDNGGGDDDGIAGEEPGMRLLRLAVFSPPPDHSRNDAVALFDEAMLLCAAGRYRCAVSKLKRAVALGHVAAHAELAWLIDARREGVEPCSRCVPNCVSRLTKLGSDLGCPHSKGVWALLCFYNFNHGNRGRVAPVRGLQLARESAAAGSKCVTPFVLFIFVTSRPGTGSTCSAVCIRMAQEDCSRMTLKRMCTYGLPRIKGLRLRRIRWATCTRSATALRKTMLQLLCGTGAPLSKDTGPPA